MSDTTPERLAEPASSNGNAPPQDAGEQAFHAYLHQHGGTLLKRILDQGLSMDQNSFPFVLSYLTLAQFRAAAQVPEAIKTTTASVQAVLANELKTLYTLAAADLRNNVAALHDAAHCVNSTTRQISLPDTETIKAATESNAQTAQTIVKALSTFNQRLSALQRWRVTVFGLVAVLYFVGGAWFVWRDHHDLQKTIYEHVALRTRDAIDRLQYLKEHIEEVKPFLDTGVRVSVVRDSVSGDTVLFFKGRNGASLYYPRCADGKYAINVLQ
jgi:hypothetical protein